MSGAGARGAAGVVAVLLLAACGGAKKVAHPGGATAKATTAPFRLEIDADKDTNQGGPLYVVVRHVDGAGFLAEDYDAIADGLFGEPRDPAVLRKVIVRPGQVTTLVVERPLAEGEILGVYFLFSAPGDDWRMAIPDARTTGLKVVLGASGVEAVEQRR
jgi:hypothetical protein